LPLLRNYGGIYYDMDGRLLDFRPFRYEFNSSGFGTRTNNDVIMAARGHVFVDNYIDSVAQRYTLTQQQLYDQEADNSDDVWSQTSEQQNRELVSGRRAHRRYSVHARTGPQNILPALLALGYNRQFPIRAIPRHVVTMGAEGTWLPRGESPLRPRRRYQQAEVDVVLQRVVTTLLRELRNRPGDLHLTAVASVIAGLPDPEAAWDAVLTFILERPHDNAAITTVTHRTMYPTGPNTTAMDQVPQAVLLRLRLNPSAPGFWRLGEFTSQMPRPPQPGGSGGGHSSGWGGPSHPSWPGGSTQAFMADTSDSMTRGLDLVISGREENLRGRGLNPDEDKTLQDLRAHRATYPEDPGSSTPAAPAQDRIDVDGGPQTLPATRATDDQAGVVTARAAEGGERATVPDAAAGATTDPAAQQLLAVWKGLEARIGRVLAPLDAEAGPGAFEDCLLRLDAVTRDWFGNRPTVARDDFGLDTGRLQDDLAARLGGDWRRVEHSLAPVVQRLQELGDGSLALVLHSPPGRERHGIVLLNRDGHVLAVETQAKPGERVRMWNQRDSKGLPALSVAGARVVVADPSGKAVPLAGPGTESVVTATSTGEALVDDAQGLRYLGSGTENEWTNVVEIDEDSESDSDDEDADLLAIGPHGTRLVTEGRVLHRDSYRRYWWYEEDARAENVPVQEQDAYFVELIAGVMSSMTGEPGTSRRRVHRVRREVEQALHKVHSEFGSRGYRPLSSVLTHEMGWEMTERGRRARVGARPVGGWTGSNMQHNHALPLAGLRQFLEFVQPRTFRNAGNGNYWMQEHLADGLRFGDLLADRFFQAEQGRIRSAKTPRCAPYRGGPAEARR
jgi:hypothetical protein